MRSVPPAPTAPPGQRSSRPAARSRLVAGGVLLSLVVGLPLVASPAWATPYTYDLELIAGTGASGSPAASGGAALSGPVSTPAGQAVDSSGNLYVADTANHVVLKVTSAGVSSRFAGTGVAGTTSAGTATGTALDSPVGVAVGRDQEIYISDPAQRKVFAVDTSGQLTVVAGNGSQGSPSTSAAPTASPFEKPTALAVDNRTLYIVDEDANRVLSMSTQNLSTPMTNVLGTGTRAAPTFGQAINSAPPATALGRITGIAVAGGKKWITDATNCYVIYVDNASNSSALAGNGTCGAPTLGGAATSSRLVGPQGVAVDGSTPFVTDGARVLTVDSSNLVAVGGTGATGAPVAARALQSPLTSPTGIAAGPGNSPVSLYVSDSGAHRVVRLVPLVAPAVNTFSPPAAGTVGTPYSSTFSLSSGSTPVTWSVTAGALPAGLALDPATGVLSGTPTTPGTSSYTVRATNAAGTSDFATTQAVLGTYALSVVAGSGSTGAPDPSLAAPSSPLQAPVGAAVDAAGNAYFVDSTSAQVLKVTPAGVMSVVSTGAVPLSSPKAVAVDAGGDLYIADGGSTPQVVLVPSSGPVVRLAGTGSAGSGAITNGTATSRDLQVPSGLAVSGSGSSAVVHVSDSGAHQVVSVSRSTSQLTVVAGTGTAGTPVADGSSSATTELLQTPGALAVHPTLGLLIADPGLHKVLMVSSGFLDTLVGDGTAGALVTGPVSSSRLNAPQGLVVDAGGSVYVSNDRKVGVVYTVGMNRSVWLIAGSGTQAAPTAGPALTSAFDTLVGLAASPNGTVYTTDAASRQVLRLVPNRLAAITSTAPPAAVTGTAYTHTFTASPTATAPLTWSVTNGSLPAGLTLNASTGVLSGTPTAVGSSPFTVGVTNPAGVATQAVTLAVSAPAPAGGGGTPPPVTASIPPGLARVQGADRTATAVSVSSQLFPRQGGANGAVVATDATFADGIGGAGLAASVGGPMLFTGKDALDDATAGEIKRSVKPGGTVYVLGGTAAVSDAVVAQLKALGGYTITRLGGADRYATSVLIADVVGPRTGSATPPVYLASGTDHPDALTVASLAAHRDGVVLLTAGSTMPKATDAWLDAHDAGGTSRTTTVGGPATTALPGAKDRLVGADRYATSALVAKEFGDKARSVGVASGTSWPDALVGSAAMGVVDGPLLLTDPTHLSPATSGYLGSASTVKGAWLFGGEKAVSPAAEGSLRGLLPRS